MPRKSPDKAVSQFRIDITVFEKLKIIAAREQRSMNNQLEVMVTKGVQEYEREHGEIILPSSDE